MFLNNEKGHSLVTILVGASLGIIAVVGIGATLISSSKFSSKTQGDVGIVEEISLFQRRLSQTGPCMGMLPASELGAPSFDIPWNRIALPLKFSGTATFHRVVGAKNSAEIDLTITDSQTKTTNKFKVPIAISVNASNIITACSSQAITSSADTPCEVSF